MRNRSRAAFNDASAHAFFGQSEEDFSQHIKSLGAVDPRLVKVFEKTRQHYLDGVFDRIRLQTDPR